MLEKENPWIISEKHMFEKIDDDIYSFANGFEIKEISLKYYRLKDEYDKLVEKMNNKLAHLHLVS